MKMMALQGHNHFFGERIHRLPLEIYAQHLACNLREKLHLGQGRIRIEPAARGVQCEEIVRDQRVPGSDECCRERGFSKTRVAEKRDGEVIDKHTTGVEM